MASSPVLLPGTMCESMTLQEPRSVLVSMALVTTEVHVDDWGLAKHLGPYQSPKVMLHQGHTNQDSLRCCAGHGDIRVARDHVWVRGLPQSYLS